MALDILIKYSTALAFGIYAIISPVGIAVISHKRNLMATLQHLHPLILTQLQKRLLNQLTGPTSILLSSKRCC